MPRSRSPRIITLLTDFGQHDHYVGAMKGVILSLAPEALVVDVSHEVASYSLAEARFMLAQSWPYFPEKTIHVVVVDPGVGTTRRAILVDAGRQLFLGPDNGVFSEIVRREDARARVVTNEKLFRNPVSSTFHGRDIFAPVAAHLAMGLAPSRVGPRVDNAWVDPLTAPTRTGKRTWSGEIVSIDKFGNVITSFRTAEFPQLAERPFVLKVGLAILGEVVKTYAAIPSGTVAVVLASHGHLEAAANQDSAARRLGVACGSPVELEIL
jgi:S-adenosylmethionine hydrolase